MTVRVFAYGSNMCSGRLLDYIVNPVGPGVAAVLRNHRLCFNKRSARDHSGKANVEPHEGAEVWGVIYEIPNAELPNLDTGEGGYVRRVMMVQSFKGNAIEAWVYLARNPDPDPALRPYTWYKRFLVDGAIQHGLPEAYIQMLQAIEAIDDPDRERDRHERDLRCSE